MLIEPAAKTSVVAVVVNWMRSSAPDKVRGVDGLDVAPFWAVVPLFRVEVAKQAQTFPVMLFKKTVADNVCVETAKAPTKKPLPGDAPPPTALVCDIKPLLPA
tara:strand:- start:239 stop:547 length:309 start_codon:yes stop_codon:yes gene_type:complete